jgi:hypothetical protein
MFRGEVVRTGEKEHVLRLHGHRGGDGRQREVDDDNDADGVSLKA